MDRTTSVIAIESAMWITDCRSVELELSGLVDDMRDLM